MDLAATVRKVEELPSDGGKIVDTLAGAVLRVFARLGEFETEIGRLKRRLAAIEAPQTPVKAEASSETAPARPPAPPGGVNGRSGVNPFGGREDQ
jgi:hypothetical protein